jgi:hypothetical protein
MENHLFVALNYLETFLKLCLSVVNFFINIACHFGSELKMI